MLAFAGNSVLCRLALSPDSFAVIDPASFSAIRLLSGAVTLVLVVLWRERCVPWAAGSWCGALALFIYMAAFTYAYVQLDTGVGALILFGVVQLVMLLAALRAGQRLQRVELAGLILAFTGLLLLLLPGATSPSLPGAILMIVAGLAWAVYTLVGREAVAPLLTTCGNFVRAVPLLVLLALAVLLMPDQSVRANTGGVWLAIVSGGLSSALGYAIWYRALAGLGVTQAGVVQLSVPVLAAVGGVWFVNETLSVRFIASGALVLGGIYCALRVRRAT